MTSDQIGKSLNPGYPGVYTVTSHPTALTFKNNQIIVGYFQPGSNSELLKKENKYTFVEFGENANKYKETKDERFLTTINGDDLKQVEYPSGSGWKIVLKQPS